MKVENEQFFRLIDAMTKYFGGHVIVSRIDVYDSEQKVLLTAYSSLTTQEAGEAYLRFIGEYVVEQDDLPNWIGFSYIGRPTAKSAEKEKETYLKANQERG